jgi:hypothetical protein
VAQDDRASPAHGESKFVSKQAPGRLTAKRFGRTKDGDIPVIFDFETLPQRGLVETFACSLVCTDS